MEPGDGQPETSGTRHARARDDEEEDGRTRAIASQTEDCRQDRTQNQTPVIPSFSIL
jgi:hypothetical protein